MNRIRQFAAQSVIYGIGSILPRIVYYLLVVVFLTNILGDRVSEFGIYGTFYAYATVLIFLFSFRLDTGVFRFGGGDKLDLESVYSTAFLFVGFLSVMVIILGHVFAQEIAAFIHFPDKSRYVKWFSFILAFDILILIPFAKLRIEDKAILFSTFKVLNVLVSSLLILFFLFIVPRYGHESFPFVPVYPLLIDYVFISNLIASGAILLMLVLWTGRITAVPDLKLLSKLLLYCYPLVILSIANSVSQYFSAPLQEGLIVGDQDSRLAQVGSYEFARRIASLYLIFTTAFNYAAEPFFFNNASPDDRKALYGKICRLFTLISGVIILGLYLGLDLIKLVLSNEHFWGHFDVLPVLLVGYLFLGIYYNISIWYKLSDKTHYGAIIAVIGMIVMLVINLLLLSQLGVVASAWATFGTNFTMLALAYYWGRRHFPIAYPMSKILINILIICGILIIAYFIQRVVGKNVSYMINCVLFVMYLLYVFYTEKAEWMSLLSIGSNKSK